MAEQKKPSSLRTRMDRTRKAYRKPVNPVPIIAGGVFVLLVAVGLVLAFKGGGGRRKAGGGEGAPGAAAPAPAATAPVPLPGLLPGPAGPPGIRSNKPEDQVYGFIFEAKEVAKTNPQAAIEKLKGALGKWAEYDAEMYSAMAFCRGKDEMKLRGEALRRMWADKYGWYAKAQELVDAGGKFAYGNPEQRKSQLKECIRVSKKNSGM